MGEFANGLLTTKSELKCQQCGRPAIHIFPGEREGGPLPLCLDHSLKLQHFYEIEAAQLERDYNVKAAEVEMVYGVSGLIPRYPPRPTPNVIDYSGATLNNIHIKDSTVGVVNTGSIQRVDVAIGAVRSTGEEGIADAVRQLAEAIASTNDLGSRLN